jgi:carboxypeptidase Q
MRILTIILALAGLLLPCRGEGRPGGSEGHYRELSQRIISAATHSTVAWDRLAYFCDHFPARLSGSTNLERGIDWMLTQLKQDGFENVHGEKVVVPHWSRGEESAEAIAPIHYKLHMLGLGGSVGTPADGITAEVLVVRDFDELAARKNEARDKIVVFNLPFTTYGETVKVRTRGAIEAAKAGAVASLIGSVASYSMRTPHTGGMRYDPSVPKIPHAAITLEDAGWLARMQKRGEKSVVKLRMQARTLAPAQSRNVVAEIKGSEFPENYILLSGHLDSWDVGQGAMDDGGGCLAVWEAMRILKELGLKPRCSLRMVFFTNEENGVAGARQYAQAHSGEIPHFIMAFESDEGVFQPLGFRYSGPAQGRSILNEAVDLLGPIGVKTVEDGAESTDTIFMREKGVPTLDLVVDETKYFWFHHSDADTLDKLTPAELNRCAAAIAVAAYMYAEAEGAGRTGSDKK